MRVQSHTHTLGESKQSRFDTYLEDSRVLGLIQTDNDAIFMVHKWLDTHF